MLVSLSLYTASLLSPFHFSSPLPHSVFTLFLFTHSSPLFFFSSRLSASLPSSMYFSSLNISFQIFTTLWYSSLLTFLHFPPLFISHISKNHPSSRYNSSTHLISFQPLYRFPVLVPYSHLYTRETKALYTSICPFPHPLPCSLYKLLQE